MMAGAVYISCGVASLIVMLLLFRGYRQSGARLLLWAGLCFLGLSINNVLVFVDLVLVPHTDLLLVRNLTGLAGMMALLYGLIWDSAN